MQMRWTMPSSGQRQPIRSNAGETSTDERHTTDPPSSTERSARTRDCDDWVRPPRRSRTRVNRELASTPVAVAMEHRTYFGRTQVRRTEPAATRAASAQVLRIVRTMFHCTHVLSKFARPGRSQRARGGRRSKATVSLDAIGSLSGQDRVPIPGLLPRSTARATPSRERAFGLRPDEPDRQAMRP